MNRTAAGRPAHDVADPASPADPPNRSTDRSARFTSRFSAAEESVGFLLWKVANLHQAQQRRALAGLDLTPTQFSVLACIGDLASRGRVTQTDVCRHAALDKMLVSDSTRALVTKGFVARTPDESDGRSALIAPTDVGWSVCTRALRIIEDLDEQFFAGSQDVATLAASLRAILSHGHDVDEHADGDARGTPFGIA